MLIGDDHARIAAASKLASERLGCKVFRGSPYYRKEGVGLTAGHAMCANLALCGHTPWLTCTHALAGAGHLQDHFNQQSWEDKCSGTVQLLIDMELLAHTDYFVGSYNSRWPRVVQYLRYILYNKDRSTSVDASAYHLDLFSNIKYIFLQDNP